MKLLNNCVIKSAMLHFRDKSDRQHSTAEANESRLAIGLLHIDI